MKIHFEVAKLELTSPSLSIPFHFSLYLQIGNIDIPESGALDLSFFSPHIRMYGERGIIGRSIVIHERPIEFTRSPDIYGVPVANQAIQPVSYQTEETSVGAVLACGIISIVQNQPQNI